MKSFMVKAFFISFFITLTVILALRLVPVQNFAEAATRSPAWWSVQSIDTMKYSRDLSREKIADTSFNEVINTQIDEIAKTGATHVGIATPYDEEFVPMLSRWVNAARQHNLKVWFRGNFSGWEQWFEYKTITRDEHVSLLSTFITKHPELFIEGDIFTPCPECENGGPGDPRKTGDVNGHRLFLITEYTAATDAFRKIGKGVRVGYFSMNYDVAKIIMDKATTEAVGGIVTIDHYVKSPKALLGDIQAIAKQSGGQVFLGEFGAPIPDIHGDMTEEAQSAWLADAFALLAKEPAVIGINYWVNRGGSTQLWSEEGIAQKAVATVTAAFTPPFVSGRLVNQINKPIAKAKITYQKNETYSDSLGRFKVAYLSINEPITIQLDNYREITVNIRDFPSDGKIIMTKTQLSWFESILDYIINLFN